MGFRAAHHVLTFLEIKQGSAGELLEHASTLVDPKGTAFAIEQLGPQNFFKLF